MKQKNKTDHRFCTCVCSCVFCHVGLIKRADSAYASVWFQLNKTGIMGSTPSTFVNEDKDMNPMCKTVGCPVYVIRETLGNCCSRCGGHWCFGCMEFYNVKIGVMNFVTCTHCRESMCRQSQISAQPTRVASFTQVAADIYEGTQ
jgi:hypothetical protein